MVQLQVQMVLQLLMGIVEEEELVHMEQDGAGEQQQHHTQEDQEEEERTQVELHTSVMLVQMVGLVVLVGKIIQVHIGLVAVQEILVEMAVLVGWEIQVILKGKMAQGDFLLFFVKEQ